MEASILPKLKSGSLKSIKDTDRILDAGVLKTVAAQMLTSAITDETYGADFRTRTMVHTWPVTGIVGVNGYSEDGWFNAVSSQLDSMRGTITNQQANGRWEPSGYEFDIRPFSVGGSVSTMFFMGVRWVDLDNEEDIKYSGGAPVNVNVKVQSAPAADNSELKEVMAMLAANQAGLQDLLGKVLTTKPAAKAPRDKKTRTPTRPTQKQA